MLMVRKTEIEDAALLAPDLRAADRQEIAAVTGETPEQMLRRSIRSSSPCYSIVDEHDHLVALFGAAPDWQRENTGLVWLLGTDALASHAFTFLLQCKGWIDQLHTGYPILRNYIDARNEVHLRWLSWCGFQITGRIERYGVEQRPFYEFMKGERSVTVDALASHCIGGS